jgi:hypothetical protein
MQPLQPMEPMEPMTKTDPWWPVEFGTPSTSGCALDVRYAVFPEKRRLVVERAGTRTTYDTGEHLVRGVLQSSRSADGLAFVSQNGPVDLESLAIASGV